MSRVRLLPLFLLLLATPSHGANDSVTSTARQVTKLAEGVYMDLDETWAKGFFKPGQIVAMVYRDLKRTVK